mmetsp:Transcript_179716/g.437287  ORF Transcript_179716/g.437287 Transcript_179716/m.437287 type:complete len:300 (+) Transcript_179716:311-1210(+)
MRRRTASFTAVWQRPDRSAPVMPSDSTARRSRSASLATAVLRSVAFRMPLRASRSGNGMNRSCPRRPGRRIAGSNVSGRLVAPMMKRLAWEFMPSISVSNWFTTRSPAPPAEEAPCPPRCPAIESSSSKKRMHGADWRAFSNTSRTFSSASPNHLLSNCGPLTEMKLAEHSFAIAFASNVLPHPGGPHMSAPRGGSCPISSKNFGFVSGISIISRSSCFTLSRPPMSLNFVDGVSTATSRMRDGVVWSIAPMKSAMFTLMFSRKDAGRSSSSMSITPAAFFRMQLIADFWHSACRSAPT